MCVAPPILSLLTQQGELHPSFSLQLAGWLRSASHIRKQAFNNQLKPYLLQPGGMEHPRPMHQLGKDGIAGFPEGVTFALPALTNKSRTGQDLKTSFHACFEENPNLCVVKCLKVYEHHTSAFRPLDPSKHNKLLVSYIRRQTSQFRVLHERGNIFALSLAYRST